MGGVPAFADGPPQGTADRQIEALLASKEQRTPAQRKVSSQLLNTASNSQLAEAAGSRQPPEAEGSRQPRGTVASARQQAVGPDSVAELELVTVDIRANVTAAVLARIRALGGTVINSVPKFRAIRAQLPLTAVEPLAALRAVQFIRPADEAVTRKDNTSEGDAAHRANLARATHGVTGTGIGIGVLSSGVSTLADRQESGDLPARVTVLPGQEGSGDEGTALLEIVHDIAPGAELYFATGYSGQAQFAANIEALCEAGANVIIDDVGYYREANLQDDIVARGVNAATDNGCYFFSAAGNDGNLNDGTSGVWEGDYAAGTSLIVGGETVGVRHDFGGGQEENPIEGSFYGTVVLQWADPLGASTNDYDLFLVDSDGNVVASSTDTQDGAQDPIESISSGFFAYSDARLVVVKVSGADRYLRLQVFGRQLEIATAGNTWGHSAAENALGVGQVDVGTAGGADGDFDGTESVRTTSSDGPRRVFFQPDGAPVTAGDSTTGGGQKFQELSKPDLAAAGCVSTATPGFSRFCGTSAAAPHAAAIAALMLDAAGGPVHVTLAELRAAMAGAALDIEATGVDRDSGAGIVMAPGAVTAVAIAQADRNGAPTVTGILANRTLTAGSDAVTIDLTSTFTDPDSDTLTYTAVSSDPDRLEVTLTGSQVTLTPGSPGPAVVRARATDPGGLSATETFSVTVTVGNRDYDVDNDGLIEIDTLAQLDAVRYDLNGNGLVDGATWRPYYADGAFPMGALEMGCPDGCVGYELSMDLDFDTDGSGAADSGDTYWNAGAGWAPIGSEDSPFTASFTGNGHTLANLFINRPTEDGIGLFGEVQSPVTGRGVIWNVGLIKVDVTGRDAVGSLFGRTRYGIVTGSYATGRVAGGDQVGGLVGESWGNLIDTYAAVHVSGDEAVGGLVGHHLINRITTSYATGRVSGAYAVGGLAGATSDFAQLIQASYATGDVSGQGARLSPSDSGFIVCGYLGRASSETSRGGGIGGLAGSSCGIIEASYATGTVSGDVAVGGLVGSGVYVRAPRSYWDMETSGLRVGVGADDTNDNGVIDGTELQRVGVAGLATAALQAPTGYEGIYGRWNVDLGGRRFGDGEADEPWDFGTSTQYPVLSVDLSGDDTETWREFGYQFRTRFSLSSTTADGQAQVNLRWDAADVSPWKPAPSVTYTVYRDDGSTAAAVAEDLTGTVYADTDVTTGDRYTYWVAAVIAGGEVVRSTAAPVTAGAGNQPPLATGTLADVTLLLGADAVTVDVAGAFRDPDDDTLTHTAATSDASVATVSVLGSPVTITPVGAGRAIVTVTSTDAVGSNPSATQRFRVTVGNDYDTDDDRLIEIRTLAQLDAMRHNLNGQSVPDDDAFALAFPESIDHWGCGFDGCSGYELEADLDFDTDGSGGAGAGDTYWNGGAGWAPIGVSEFRSFGAFNTTFDGNDHVIANLFVRGADQAGLFGGLGQSGVIRNLSVIDVDVVGVDSVGGLVGTNFGAVIASETTGKVSGDDGVGGLVGKNDGTITRSRSFATATPAPQPPPCSPSPCVILTYDIPGIGGLVGTNFGAITSSYATGAVDGYPAGGLTGYNNGTIISSYATGPVTGTTVGGLVGRNGRRPGRISASYATGSVSGGLDVGGLVGTNVGRIHSSYATGPQSRRSSYGGGLVGNGGHLVGASYWDSTTSGISSSRDRGNTTAELQAPDGYNGLYASWNLDLYGDSARDDPWDFGTTTQYPALSVDFDGDGQATWQEFGHQLRAGPGLEVEAEQGQAVLAWTAVDSGHWTPPPGITYNIYRSKDSTVATLVENLDALEYTDPDVTDGPYIYQVAAVADGGQATHSARVAASNTSNTAPDLMVESPSVTDSTPDTGGSLTLSATVNNGGDGSSATTTLRYYRSTDATITTSDTSVGTDAVGALAAGATSSETIRLTAPATAGTYYYGACVDAVTNESDTANNCSAAVRVTVVAPSDLVVDPPTVSASSPVAGSLFTLRATVRNRGSGATLVFLTLSYYSSTDDTISTSDTLEGTDAVAALAAGASSAESIRLFAPAAAGTYYYGACVSKLTHESDTTNNCSAAVAITVESAIVPDLVVGTPTVSPSSPLTGASFTLRATVSNQGTGAAGSTTLRYYRSTDSTISTSDTSVGTDPVSSLGAGNTSDESISVTAPATTGTYYYGACVGTVTNESDTTNNCSVAVAVTVGAAPAPDLVVEAPTVSDSSPLTGASFTLSARVRNLGSGAAGSTTLRYYRSSDATIFTSDTLQGTDAVGALAAGASSAESISVTAPSTAGTYYYGACVDTVTNESDTTNNCSTAMRVTVVGPPDLVVGAPTVSDSSLLTGASFTLSARVRNSGGSAAGATTLRYYRSSHATISTSDTLQGTDAVSGLGAGNTSAESISLTAPDTAGTYYYGACVGTVTNESDTTNNCSAAVAVTVVNPPDLVVGAPTVSDSNPTAGTSFTLFATVRNQGGAAAAGTTLRYYRSSDASISTSDTPQGTDAVPSLGSGNTSAESISLTAPATTGTYYYGACVGTVTNESDRTNNCSVAVAATVGAAPAPDLVVDAPTVSDSSPLTGASFTLSATVRNQGSAAAAGSTLRYYSSSDASISTSDTSVGTDAVSGLGAGASSAESSISLTAPASAGTYYYGACVGTVTNESDRTNNCSVAVRVTVGAAPVFREGASTDRSVVENSAAGTDVGPAVTATDADNDTLTYSLEGTDAASFSIVSTRGQIQTSAELNHEARPSYSVRVKADDGKGGTATIGVTISVTDENEPPTVNGRDELTLSENDENFSESYSASDPEGVASTLTWSVAGTDGGDFNIDRSTGELTFRNTPNYESPADSNRNNEYLVTVRATDEGGLSGSLDVTVTVENVDELPTITGDQSPSFPENSLRPVATYRATDPEQDIVTWSVSGTDRDDFEISDAGVLTFVNIPDFENPTDSDEDNEYLVTVEARDEGFNTGTLDVTVTVTNSAGAEEPTITTTSAPASYRENGTGVVHTFRARDPQGRPVSWTVTGTDSHAFEISSGGVLTFRNPPDFERPADDNGDNVYELTVVVTDDQGLTDSFDFTVTVTNHHENQEPAITTRPGSGLTYQKLNYQENRTSTVHTYSARNYGSGSIIWSLSGTDDGSFDISGLGALTFKSAPNHEAPGDSGGDNDYGIAVVASNSGGYSDRLNVVITVTDVNEGPEIARTGSAPGSVPENHDPLQMLARYTATDPEGVTVSRWRTSGTDGGDFVINEQGELRFRNTPDYERPADSNRDNSYVFAVQVSDGRNYGSFDETVTVTPVNEPPVITTTSGSATELRQEENRTSRLYTYRATDPERSTVTWSVGGTDARFFTMDEQGQFSFMEDSPPNFEQPGDSGGDNVYEVTIQATDDGSNTVSLPVTVTVIDVNEPPEITGQQTLSFAENQATDLVLATYSATDPEDTTTVITRWSLSGTDGGDFTINDQGELRFRTVPDHERPADSGGDNVYSFSIRASDGRNYGYLPVTVTITDVNEPPTITSSSRTDFTVRENGTAAIHTFRATDPEQVEIAWSLSGDDGGLFAIYDGNVTFKNFADFEEPGDSGGDNVYDVTIQARDDIRNTATLPITVTVTDVDEPPEITGQQNLSFAENHATERVLASYRATDPEDPSALITRWSTSGTDGGDFTINEQGELRFRNIPDYERPADSGRDNVYSLSVRASDGSLYGYLPVTVTVTDVNEPPTITTVSSSATTLRQDENRTSRLYSYRATDPERRAITWSVGGVDRNFFTIDEQGQFSFSETSPPNFEQPSDSGGDNVYDVMIEVRDDISNVDSLPVTVTVRDVNEPPDVTGQQNLSFAENQSTGRVLATYNAVDPEDPSAEITRWSLSGTDGGDFVINEQGELRFRNVPDYERPADSGRDNVYSFSVRASDGSLYGYLSVTVTVTDVNEPPVITTVSGSAMALRQDENRTSRLYSYRATDPERRTVTWSVGGVDRNFFTIDEQGQFSFSETSPPNFEQPSDSGGDNVYDVTIEVRDDISNVNSLPVTVTVRDVNEPPDVTGQQGLSFAENQSTDRVLATYNAVDPENPSAEITRWSTSGTDGGDFTVNEQGELRFRNVPDYERPADSGKDNSYSFSVRASDGSLYGYLPVPVTVTDVNEPPTITTTSGSATELRQDENRTSRLYTYRATDPEQMTITWSVGGVDRNFFTIDEQGQLSFSDTSPPNFEQPGDSGGGNVYDVTIEVRDDGSNTASLPVAVTVRDVNEPPEVSGQQGLSFSENQSTDRVLATYSATDPEDTSALITRWSLSGTDGGDFTVNEQGELRFRNVPDYERPADSGKDNSYSFSVRASDGSLYGYLPVTVAVTDVNEPPTITTVSSSAMVLRQDENRTSRLYTYRATDPERSTVTWSVSGVDRNHFTIDDQGQFSFSETSPPNFEQPSDSGGDNVYDVTIEVRDDIRNTDSLPVTVTVRDVNEPPDVTGQQGLSFSENQSTDRVLATYSATDPENPSAEITRWSTSGTDGGDFTINEQGELRFRNVPDYERPADSGRDNVYNFSVRASDGRLYGHLPVTVTVTNVNEPPAITTTSRADFTYRENVTATIYTFRATDPEGETIGWSTAGADGDDFMIEGGALRFAGPPNFEQPQGRGSDSNQYLVTIQASDDALNSGTLDVVVTVSDVNEGPEIARTGIAPGSVPENHDASLVLARYTATDPEGGTVSRWRTSGTDGGDFTINEDGELTFRNVPDYERPADSNRDNTYVFTVQVSDGRVYGSFDETVTVTDVNEPPTITTVSNSAITLRQDENRTSRLYTYRATDPERSAVAWSIGGVDRNFFTIDEQGQFSFSETSPPNFEQPGDSGGDNVYDVTVQVTDDGPNTASLPVTVTVRDVNEPPEVSGQQSLSFAENHATDRVLATYSAIDPEDPSALITRWSTSGTDGGDFTIDESGQLRFRNIPDYELPADSGRDNVYSFSVRASDGRLYGHLPMTVTVTDVNEPPTITTVSSSATTLRQDENRTSRLYTYRATDPERRTLTWSVVGVDRNFFTIDGQGQFSFSETSPPNFERPSDSGGDNVYDVTIEARDDISGTDSLPVTVTVRDVNEPPDVSGQQNLSFAENQSTDLVLASYNAIDPEEPSTVITRWSTSGTDGGDFTINEQGELRFRNVPDYERPADSGGDNAYHFSVRASDGRLYGYLPVTVTVTDVNEPPVITTVASSAMTLSQDENRTSRLYTYRATDPEQRTITWSVGGVDRNLFTMDDLGQFSFSETGPPNFEQPSDSDGDNVYDVTIEVRDDISGTDSLPVTVTVRDVNEPPDVAGQQALSFAENHTTDSALAAYSAIDPEDPTAVITRWSLSGTDGGDFTIDESGQLRFRNVPDYERPADSGRDNVYSFSVRASDGRLYGHLPVTVMVTDVNEPPTITTTSRTDFTHRENGTAAIYTFRATDPEQRTMAWSTAGADGIDFAIEDGALTFASPPNFERPLGSGSDNNRYLVIIEVRDDIRNIDTLSINVTVSDVNEPPEIAGQQALSSAENQATDPVLATYRATDPEDPSAVITRWSLSGTDGGDFTIDESAQLRFRNIPDYERPADSGRDNVYNFSVRASDGSLYGYLPVTVTVTDVNEPPTITTVSSSATTLRQDENRTSRLYTYRATDPERRTITWSVGGVDRNLFTIDQQGQFSFREDSPPNFEQPSDSGGDNVYDVTIEVRDDISNPASLPVTVTVTDVNEGPEISRVGSAPGSVPENHDPSQALARYTATDPEGDTVSRWRTSGTDGGDFVINEQGELRFRNTPDYERPADSGRDNSYVFTVQVSDGRNYGSFAETVTVTPVNEPPVITTTSGSATELGQEENRTSRLYTYRATDPERSTVTWSVGGVDRNFFTIDEQGQFSFMEDSPPNFEQPGDSGGDNVYDVIIRAKDDEESNTATLPVTVTVRDVNEPPDVTGQQALSFAENHATDRVLATYSAMDPEDPTVDITGWSLSGTDGGDFVINEQGELRFRNIPDHERPADSGGDNVYNFSVRASDGRLYGYLEVTVTVVAVNEPPLITGADRFGYKENGTASLHIYSATDPERSSIEWSLSGIDDDDFSIGATTGVLSFASPPDYESPTDSDTDNVYEVTVVARDDAPNSGTLEITVTVINVTDIRGTAQVGQTLSVDVSDIDAADGLTDPIFTYQWLRSDGSTETEIPGATDDAYALTHDDEGRSISLRVTFVDDSGNERILTTAPTSAVAPVPNTPATGLPTISGTVQAAETLAADTSDIVDEDGLTNVIFSHQWLADDVEIEGATSSSYTLSDDDAGTSIRVRVSFTDDNDNEEILYSEPTAAVAARPNSPATGAPTIIGAAHVGQTLTADTSGIEDTDGLDNAVFSYQWVAGSADSDIEGATSSTHVVSDTEIGKTISVRVSFTDNRENIESLTSEPTAEVAGTSVWSATLTVGIEDTNLGYSSSTNVGALSQHEFTLADSSRSVELVAVGKDGLLSFGLDKALATAFTLQVGGLPFVSGDASPLLEGDGHTYQWDGGRLGWNVGDEVMLILTTDNRPAAGLPAIIGTVQTGETLTADTSGIDDEDGLTNVIFSYQWVRNEDDDEDIEGATSYSYTLVSADEGATFGLRVYFTDDGGNHETLTSTSTDPVLPVPPIWSATVTPGTLSDGYGYNFGGPGELTETSFELDGVTYTIEKVLALGWMYIYMDGVLTTDLAFEVNGKRFRLVDASVTDHGGETLYTWSDAGMNWSVGESVQMELYRE